MTNHTPSTEEREAVERILKKGMIGVDAYDRNKHIARAQKAFIAPTVNEITKLLASTREEAEAALVDKLRPLLVDEPTDGVSYHTSDVRSHQNALRAELRQALGINLDQEGEDE